MPTLVRSRPAAAAAAARAHPGVALATILTAQLMLVLDGTVVNIALARIRAGLDFSTASLSWVISAYALTYGGLLLLGGRAGDLAGRRRVFVGGIAVFTAASALAGLAPSAGWLLAARAVQGVGAALASPAALALLSTTRPVGPARTRAFALYGAVSAAGSAIGLLAGGLLTSALSWRWIFFINLPIGVVLLVAAMVVLPETERHPGRLDVTGAVTSTAAMTALVYGFVHAASSGWQDPTTVTAFAAAAVLLLAFVVVEVRTRQPLIPLRLFRDRSRSSTYLIRLPLFASMYGVFFYTSQFLQNVLGYSALRAGLAYLPMTAALVLSSRFAAGQLRRFDGKYLAAGGIAVTGGGLLWLRTLSESTSYVGGILGPTVLIGLGMGLPFVALTVVAMSDVDPADAGAASGLVNVTNQLGGAIGLSILVTAFQSNFHHSHSFVAAAGTALTWSAVLLGCALVLSLVGVRTRGRASG